jgi:hypothetical protein
LQIKDYIKSGKLNPSNVGFDTSEDVIIYKTILDFYSVFITGNNKIDNTLWEIMDFTSNSAIPFYLQSIFSRSRIDYSIEETMEILNSWLDSYYKGKNNYVSLTGAQIKTLINAGKS